MEAIVPSGVTRRKRGSDHSGVPSGSATRKQWRDQGFGSHFRLGRYSGTIARTVHESDLRTIRVSCAKDYSYLNAAIGSTRMADELLKPLILLTNWSEAA